MSLATWKEEFYPIGASEVDKAQSAAHSLRKWIGLRQENLDKHGVYLHSSALRFTVVETEDAPVNDGLTTEVLVDELDIDSSSCALCARYYDHAIPGFTSALMLGACKRCPIVVLTGTRCDMGTDSPWHAARFGGDVEPMIALLQKLVDNGL